MPNRGRDQRLGEIFAATQLARPGRLHFPHRTDAKRFSTGGRRIALVSGNELFHRADLNRPSRRRLGQGNRQLSGSARRGLRRASAHGIARYRGLKLLAKERQVEEHLVLEFHGETKIYVPVSKIELVQKYVGGTKSRPTLARIGGRMWSRQKENAERAVEDLAADMLSLQAARSARPGIGFGPDTAWQREFDASFPYRETADQLSAIAAIKGDMHAPGPMDRLLCGDVGFGKTEAGDAGRLQGGRRRIPGVRAGADDDPGGAALAHISAPAWRRFRSKSLPCLAFCHAERDADILQGLATGSLDIVIGTHRLAQHDVQFQNLGLLIIDEEQRFGVEVKERLKAMRPSSTC